MKVSEVILDAHNFIFNTNERKSGQHYKYLMDLGRILPTTKAQARYFVANRCKFDVLNIVDVERIEALFSEFGGAANINTRVRVGGLDWLILRRFMRF